MTKLTTYVALLRGINVGGKTMVSMADLKVIFEKLGYQNVRTYINSGNVIFRTKETDLRELEQSITKAISDTLDLNISVVVRSFAEVSQVVKAFPDSWKDQNTYRCYAIFLRYAIDTPDVLKQIGTPKPEVEELAYAPGVIFWALRLDSLTKSGLDKLLSTPLYKEMTIRNQNTTRKIYGIMQEVDKLAK